MQGKKSSPQNAPFFFLENLKKGHPRDSQNSILQKKTKSFCCWTLIFLFKKLIRVGGMTYLYDEGHPYFTL